MLVRFKTWSSWNHIFRVHARSTWNFTKSEAIGFLILLLRFLPESSVDQLTRAAMLSKTEFSLNAQFLCEFFCQNRGPSTHYHKEQRFQPICSSSRTFNVHCLQAATKLYNPGLSVGTVCCHIATVISFSACKLISTICKDDCDGFSANSDTFFSSLYLKRNSKNLSCSFWVRFDFPRVSFSWTHHGIFW